VFFRPDSAAKADSGHLSEFFYLDDRQTMQNGLRWQGPY